MNPTVFEKLSGFEKVLCMRRGYQVFPSKIFGLTLPKNFLGHPFNVSENLGYRKILCIIGVSQFSV